MHDISLIKSLPEGWSSMLCYKTHAILGAYGETTKTTIL